MFSFDARPFILNVTGDKLNMKGRTHMQRKHKLISMILALLLALSFVPYDATARTETGSPADDYSAPIEAGDIKFEDDQQTLLAPVILEEDVSKREEFAKHFFCDIGSSIAISYPWAVHMERDGEWVDAAFPLTDEESHLVTENADISLSRSTGTAGQDGIVRFRAEGYELAWGVEAHYGGESVDVKAIEKITEANVLAPGQRRSSDSAVSGDSAAGDAQLRTAELLQEKKAFAGELGTVSAKDLTSEEAQRVANLNEAIEVANREKILDVSFARSVVEYPDALGDGTILRYILSPGRVKEEIVLEEHNGFVSYSMLMDTGGLAGELRENNEVFLVDESGEAIFHIAAPYMYDEAGESSSAFIVTIAEEDGKLIVTYAPDMKWLNDEGRVWPVVIDPTIDSKSIPNANQIDNYIWEDGRGGPAEPFMWAGNRLVGSPATRKPHRIFWRLGVLPSLGSNYTINSASFHIRVHDSDSTMGSSGLSLYKVNATWTSGGIAWPGPGISLVDSCNNHLPSTSPKWKVFDSANVTTTVKGWYTNTSTNHGFHLRYASTTDQDASRFYSADNGVSYIPYILIDYSGTVLVSSITVSPSSTSLSVGATKTLIATVAPTNATNKALSWTTSNSSVATVSSSGVVTAKASGTATIKAAATDGSGKYSQCTVTVSVPVTSVTVSPTSTTMVVGNLKTLAATVYPSNATNKAVTWTSSIPSVATVSSSGLVTAKRTGTTIITVKTADGGKTATCTVTVSKLTYSNIKVYQSLRPPGKENNGDVARDMIVGGKTKQQLMSMNVTIGGMATFYDSSPAYVENQARLLADFFTLESLDMWIVAREMFDRFISGTGADYRSNVLNLYTVAHPSTVNYRNLAQQAIINYIKNNNGDPSGAINNQAIKKALADAAPVYDQPDDYSNGLTICVNDTWGSYIEIKNYQFDGMTFSGTLKYTIYDHFGLDDLDMTGNYGGQSWIVGHLPYFSAWYVLQRYTACNGKYKPFITYIEHEFAFSGNL